jgi:6-phosphogluconate dehydrogenase
VAQVTFGLIGLGRMGAGLAQRALRGGHQVVVTDVSKQAVADMQAQGALPADSIASLVAQLPAPRAVWVMVPAGEITNSVLTEVAALLEPGDVLIDGGNSPYTEAIARSKELSSRGIDFIDVGTSGGVWGLERGYCLMIGGPGEAVGRLAPLWESLCPGIETAPRTSNAAAATTVESGWLHCGPSGAGHFVKMVHNGIEYGLMAAYAEGFNILAHADSGTSGRAQNAETAPLAHPEHYQYDFDLPAIAEVWRRGSVVSSWLLDLTAAAFGQNPTLDGYAGRVSDSGEGRWTVNAAVDTGVPVPVLTAALYSRFASRDEDALANRVLSAMRHAFGGHLEQH